LPKTEKQADEAIAMCFIAKPNVNDLEASVWPFLSGPVFAGVFLCLVRNVLFFFKSQSKPVTRI